MAVFFIQSEPSADLVADASSKLYGRAFAPGGTACEMSQYSGNEDQGSGAQRHVVLGADSRQHLICPAVLPADLLVQKDDQDTGQGKEKKDPVVLPAVFGDQS